MTDFDTPNDTPQPRASVFGVAPVSPRAAFWLVALTFTLSLSGSLLIRQTLLGSLPDTLKSLVVGMVLSAAYVIELAVVRAMARSQGTTFSALIGWVPPHIGSSPRAWVAVAVGEAFAVRALAALYGVLVDRLGLHVPGADSDPLSVFPGGTASAIVLIIVVVLIAPFAEEVVFRGVVLPSVGARWGIVTGIVASSVLFAAFHASVYLLLPIFVAALSFASLAARFRSLWPAYLAHATFNAVAVFALLVLRWQGVV